MHEILSQYTDLVTEQQIKVDGVTGFQQGEHIYIIIPSSANPYYHYEQRAVAEFLLEQGIENLAVPVSNANGELLTVWEDKEYVVLRINNSANRLTFSHPEQLARFHQAGAGYPYQPNTFSSYGHWKKLWADKLAYFEKIYHQLYEERPVSRYQRLIIDTFPYLSGLTENALQYLQETETETRYHNNDQPTFTFQRYRQQSEKAIIWPNDIVYDHPARDIAEYLRGGLLQAANGFPRQVNTFLNNYNNHYPLSIFGWRLVFARLLLPVHLFDQIEQGLLEENQEVLYKDYKKLLESQTNYEIRLKSLFSDLGIDSVSLNIPNLDW